MQLTFDIGNSRIKFGVFKDSKLIESGVVEKVSQLDDYASSWRAAGVSKGIYSSVGKPEVEKDLTNKLSFIQLMKLTHDTSLPIKLDYETPKTLGIDRIAVSVGGFSGNVDTMVIDAGSCITYDIVSRDGYYRGGAITPGIKMRLKAMHHFTARLPLLDDLVDVSFPSKSTGDCMQLGGVTSVEHEMKGFIAEFNKIYNNGRVLLTGGDTVYLAEGLKNHIFADNFLQLKGLNEILNYQSK
ncbi:type III pantothenate kinase [Salibacter halophilus]|uniref:Type III pantothenate kinase n=1 Tax=Salibacter halophilus TaxID=1803916 RepID=A0A6N6M654_9FLAO|nr:type III pantothenate kinase [Salibacter halophilus]KAB1063418.1 type III pantothenate kinase [Salibacter halophilus]